MCGGAAGVSQDLPIAKIARDLRPFRIYDGPSEVHRWSIARRAVRGCCRSCDPGHSRLTHSVLPAVTAYLCGCRPCPPPSLDRSSRRANPDRFVGELAGWRAAAECCVTAVIVVDV